MQTLWTIDTDIDGIGGRTEDKRVRQKKGNGVKLSRRSAREIGPTASRGLADYIQGK